MRQSWTIIEPTGNSLRKRIRATCEDEKEKLKKKKKLHEHCTNFCPKVDFWTEVEKNVFTYDINDLL